MHTSDQAREQIETVFIDESGTFAPRGFESSAVIYRLGLRGSFVGTLIRGGREEVVFSARGGRDRYAELLKWLRQLTGPGPCFWFYLCDSSPDSKKAPRGGRGKVSFVRSARVDAQDQISAPLDQFEIEPAPAGGGAYLGLLGAGWLLLHTHYAEEEFEISIHGSTRLCNDLCRLTRAAPQAEE